MESIKVSQGLELIGQGFLTLAAAFAKAGVTKVEASPTANGHDKTEEPILPTGMAAAPKEKKTAKPKAKFGEAQVVAPKEEPAKEDGPTEDDVRTALVEFAQSNSKDAAYAILGKYGAKKVNELKKEDLSKVLTELSM